MGAGLEDRQSTYADYVDIVGHDMNTIGVLAFRLKYLLHKWRI